MSPTLAVAGVLLEASEDEWWTRVGAVNRGKLSSAVVSSWGLFSALALLMLGNGLLGTLLGIRSEIEGFGTVSIGVLMAAYYVGFLAGSRLIPSLVGRVGHVRVFAALASGASISALIHVVAIDPSVWTTMRFVTGLCQAGLYIVAESWLNDLATNENRGRLLSAYMIVMMGGYAAGQYLIPVFDPAGFEIFVAASALISLAVVPISLSVGTAPGFVYPDHLKPRRVWEAAPLALVAGAATGLTNGAFMSLGAVYGTRIGMSTSRLALFMSAAFLGSAVLQWPVGAFSDRVHRRRAILVVSMAAAAVGAAALIVERGGVAMIGIAFLYGGLSFPMYSLSLSHMNDMIDADTRIRAGAVFVFAVGLGAIFGPLAGAAVLDVAGPDGFWWVLVFVHLAVGVFALLRISTREPIPIDDQRPWVQSPPRASAVIAWLASRRGSNGPD